MTQMTPVRRKGKKPVKGQTKRSQPAPVRARIINGPQGGQVLEVLERSSEESELFSSPEEREMAEKLLDRIAQSFASAAVHAKEAVEEMNRINEKLDSLNRSLKNGRT